MKYTYCKKCGTKNKVDNSVCKHCKTKMDETNKFEKYNEEKIKNIINPKHKFFAIMGLIIPILEFIYMFSNEFNPIYTIFFCFVALGLIKVSFKENKKIGIVSIVLNTIMIIISFILLIGGVI